MAKGREVIRNGKRGTEVWVAPKEGYHRFVPHDYNTGGRSAGRSGRRGG